MMSLTVLVGTLSLLPPPFPSPLSSWFSTSLHLCSHCEKSWEWQEVEAEEKEEERGGGERKGVKQLYTNQDFPEHLHCILLFTAAGTLFSSLSFSASPIHALVPNKWAKKNKNRI